MTKPLRKLIGIGALSLLAATAQAGASLNGVRIGAQDVDNRHLAGRARR